MATIQRINIIGSREGSRNRRRLKANQTGKKFRVGIKSNISTNRNNLISGVEDRKSGSAGMPRPTSYAVFCLKKKIRSVGLVLVHERDYYILRFTQLVGDLDPADYGE